MSRAGLAVAALVACTSGVARAQQGTGPWIPLGSRLDALASWLAADGSLNSLDPLTRPWQLGDVRAAASAADTSRLSRADRRVLGWLRDQLDLTGDSTVVVGEVGAAAWRHGARDGLRPAGAAGSGPMGGVFAAVSRGPFVAVLNPAFENRLKNDPEYPGKIDRIIAGRMQTSYLAVSGARGNLMYGRIARQWGPALFDGMQLSPGAYATDAIVGTLRVGRFALTTTAERLNDYDTTLAARVTRWFMAHRLTVRVGDGGWLALTETGVYGGPGRGFEPVFHAPLNLGLLSTFNESKGINLLWGAEAHVPVADGLSVEGQLVIDDLQIDHRALSDRRPWSGGMTIVVRAAPSWLPFHADIGYTRIRSLTYRNSFAPWEVYSLNGVGLGRSNADYDQLQVRLESWPAARLHLVVDGMTRRQGTGDFRAPFPSDSILALPGQGFLVGPVQHGAGLRATGFLELRRGVEINGQLGLVRVGDATQAIAGVALRLRTDLMHHRGTSTWTVVEPGAEQPWP